LFMNQMPRLPMYHGRKGKIVLFYGENWWDANKSFIKLPHKRYNSKSL